MKLIPYLGKRVLYFTPQILGILIVTFVLVRSIPGDPARLMAGPLVPEEGVELIREKMGLKGPLPYQFLVYVKNLLKGDLGHSWYTGNPVSKDIAARLPAQVKLDRVTVTEIGPNRSSPPWRSMATSR